MLCFREEAKELPSSSLVPVVMLSPGDEERAKEESLVMDPLANVVEYAASFTLLENKTSLVIDLVNKDGLLAYEKSKRDNASTIHVKDVSFNSTNCIFHQGRS